MSQSSKNASVSRPNFFLLLGLDPDAAWEQAVFEKILREKRIEWSRQSSGVARKALAARQNLALINHILEVMADQQLRQQEAATARREQAIAREAAYVQFEKQLALLNAKDTVEQEEIERFIAAFEQVCPPDEIRRRLQMQVRAPATSGGHATQRLDGAIVQAITDRLQFLHLNTLYELLQLPPGSATAALFQAAEQLYTHLVVLQPSAETTARMELAGLAREVFRSDEMHALYDECLRLASLQWLFQDLEESISRAGQPELHQRQVLLFLEQAYREGWGIEEALEQLKAYARQHRWIMTIPALFPAQPWPGELMKQGQEQVQEGRPRARAPGIVALTYEITSTTRFGKRRSLRLFTEPYTSLPIMLLVSKQGGLPVRKGDGQLFQRIKVTMGANRRAVVELAGTFLSPNTFGKLFFEDDTAYGEFMIHHPDERQMRLS